MKCPYQGKGCEDSGLKKYIVIEYCNGESFEDCQTFQGIRTQERMKLSPLEHLTPDQFKRIMTGE